MEGCAISNLSVKRAHDENSDMYLHSLKSSNSCFDIPTVLQETLDGHWNGQSSALRDLDDKSALIGVGLSIIVSIVPCSRDVNIILTIVAS